jgi:hypothetical protein
MTLAGTLAAETAAPVESLDVVARLRKERLGAASCTAGAAGSVDSDEPARRIPLRGTLYDDVIRTQRPSVEDKDEGALGCCSATAPRRQTSCSVPKSASSGLRTASAVVW